MKLFEHPETEKTLDRLPELPPGVEVPDDISGLHVPKMRKPTAGGVRWMRWMAVIALLVGGGLLFAAVVADTETEPAPVDYMVKYGTDNPTIIDANAVAATVDIVPAEDYMRIYGTDNPVFVPQTSDVVVVDLPGGGQIGIEITEGAETGEWMRIYGTDNPDFLPEPSYMDQFGTDNPSNMP